MKSTRCSGSGGSTHTPRKILGMNAHNQNTNAADNNLNAVTTNQDFNDSGFWPYGLVSQIGRMNFVSPVPVPVPVSVNYPPTAPLPFDSNTLMKLLITASDCVNEMNMSRQNQMNPISTSVKDIQSSNLNTIKESEMIQSKFKSNKIQLPVGGGGVEKSSNAASSSGSSSTVSDYYYRPDVPIVFKDNNRPSQSAELTQMAIHGCELAERLANSHRSRPCFKKIDSLCARLKQDLVRPDNVLANINSQGIAWAVKDFIFVFTRVINAWIIIKGYVYNTPEGLSKVKTTLSSEFQESFGNWEDATLKFVNAIIKSFVNLDELVQSQKNVFQKYGTNTNNPNHNAKQTKSSELGHFSMQMKEKKSSLGSLDDLFISSTSSSNTKLNDSVIVNNIAENSEESQRDSMEKGTYIKTGLYNPLRKENNLIESDKVRLDTKSIYTIENGYNEVDLAGLSSTSRQPQQQHSQPYDQNHFESSSSIQPNENVLNKFIFDFLPKCYQSERRNNFGLPTGVHNNGQAAMSRIELNTKVEYLICRVKNIHESQYFFNLQFVDNYFPEFRNTVPYCTDIRSIILKAQIGSYNSLKELVHDLRQIVYCANIYMQTNSHAFLQSVVIAFHKELEVILSEEEFASYDFLNITGSPNDKL